MKPRQVILSLLVLFGLAAYLVLFYAVRLPSIEQTTGRVWHRFDILPHVLLVPESFLESWFGSPPVVSLLDRLPVLGIAAAIVACAAGVGWLVLAAFRVDQWLDRLEVVVFSTAVGLNVLSTYVLLLGLFGWVSTRLVLVLPAAAALAAVICLLMRRAKNSPLPPAGEGQGVRARHILDPNDQGEHEESLGLCWLWLAAPFALVILLGAMLPPIDFDVREYHLQAPKEFFQQGRVGFLPHNVYGNMPLGSEMLCLLAMAAAGDWWLGALAGKTVLASFALLTALGLVAAGRRFFSTTAGVVAAVVYLSIPWVVQVSTSGLVEAASACYLLLAVYAMFLWEQAGEQHGPRQGSRYLGLAGYLAGGAVSCKYPAVLFVVLPLLVWLVAACVWRERRSRRNSPLPQAAEGQAVRAIAGEQAEHPWHGRRWWSLVESIAIFLLATTVGCGLWFAKNWALTGNPTYPLLSQVFDGKTRTPEKDRQWNRVHRPKTFSPAELGSDLARVLLRSEWLSPLVVPLAALGLLSRRHRRRATIFLLWFVYTIAAWWLLTHRIDRFWIPVLPLLSLLAGLGACWAPEGWCRKALIELPLAGLALALAVCMGLAGLPFALMAAAGAVLAWRLPDRLWLAPLLIVVGVGLNFVSATTGGGGLNCYFVSLERLRSDPQRLDAWHRYFNTHVKEGCALLVGDAQVFDVAVPMLYNTCFDDCIFEQLVENRTADQIRKALADRQVAYVFVHWGEIARYRRTGYGFTDFVQPAVFDKLVERRILEPLPVLEGHSGRGYRVLAGGG